MSNIVTMSGNRLRLWNDILSDIIDRDDVEHVVIVINRKDGFCEIQYDRQAISQIVFAASVLNAEAVKMAAEATVETD